MSDVEYTSHRNTTPPPCIQEEFALLPTVSVNLMCLITKDNCQCKFIIINEENEKWSLCLVSTQSHIFVCHDTQSKIALLFAHDRPKSIVKLKVKK